MRKSVRNGFTLVEILIVVVILGILAAIVIPQFANASNDALKGTLRTQLQTISSQLELYRVREVGSYPDDIITDTDNDGWGKLVTEGYLREAPRNGYTGEAKLADGDEDAAIGADSDSANGWYFDNTGTSGTYGQVFAAGFDLDKNLFEHE